MWLTVWLIQSLTGWWKWNREACQTWNQTLININIDRLNMLCFQQLWPLISVKHCACWLHPSLQRSKATVINHCVEGQSFSTTSGNETACTDSHTKLCILMHKLCNCFLNSFSWGCRSSVNMQNAKKKKKTHKKVRPLHLCGHLHRTRYAHA